MFMFDLPLEELRKFTLPQERPADFDEFWAGILARSQEQPLAGQETPWEYPVEEARVEKVSYAAFDGGRIVGWLIAPRDRRPRPTLLFFHGYSGGRGRVHPYLHWVMQGFTVLTFDVRGQLGESSDLAEYPGGRFTGWMTSGILEPEKYYFVRCFADTVRAIAYACTLPDVNPDRLGVTGVSQGGGLSLAAASLDARLKLCMPEVPGFCHFRRTLQLTKAAPWTDLLVYFQRRPEDIERAFNTLRYVELNNLTDRIRCPTLVSCGLQDELCPPSTIFTAYNRIPGEAKQIDVFQFNGHEGGLNLEEQIRWARKYLLAA